MTKEALDLFDTKRELSPGVSRDIETCVVMDIHAVYAGTVRFLGKLFAAYGVVEIN